VQCESLGAVAFYWGTRERLRGRRREGGKWLAVKVISALSGSGLRVIKGRGEGGSDGVG
jgi:hypothetical protein